MQRKDESLTSSTRVFVVPSGQGKTTLAIAFPDRFVDVDEIYKMSSNDVWEAMKKARRTSLITGDWSVINGMSAAILVDNFHHIGDRVLLMHSNPKHDLFDQITSWDVFLMEDLVENSILEKRIVDRANEFGESIELETLIDLALLNNNGHRKQLDQKSEKTVRLQPLLAAVHAKAKENTS